MIAKIYKRLKQSPTTLLLVFAMFFVSFVFIATTIAMIPSWNEPGTGDVYLAVFLVLAEALGPVMPYIFGGFCLVVLAEFLSLFRLKLPEKLTENPIYNTIFAFFLSTIAVFLLIILSFWRE